MTAAGGRTGVTVAALTLLLLLGAFTADGASRRYTSARYHYSVAVLPGWLVKGATENAMRHYFPSGDDPTSDKFDSSRASSANNFRIAAVPVPASMTLAAWASEVIAEVNVRFQCHPNSRSSRSVDGVPATYLLYRSCFGFYFPAIAALHGGRGYIIYWLSEADPIPKAAATFNQLVASIQFR